jgi:oligosaccharide repeat unit polymerase
VVIVIILLLPISVMSKIFFIWALINFVYAFNKYKSIFNPVSIFVTMFLCMVAFSQVKLTPLEQDDFTLNTWLSIYVTIMAFYLSSYLASKNEDFTASKIQQSAAKIPFLLKINYFVASAQVLIYIYIFIRVGGIPVQSDYIRANIMPKVISGYIMTLAVIPGFFIVYNSLYYALHKEIKLIFFNVLYTLMLLSLGGRTNILLPLGTTFILLYYVKFRQQGYSLKNNVKAVGISAALALLLLSIPVLRTNEYSKSYYKSIYEYKSDQNAPQALLPVWVNLSTNMHAFDKLVIYVDENSAYQYGKAGLIRPFHFITKHFFESPGVDFELVWRHWLNSPTFLYFPYYDFGVLGVAFFSFVLGFLGTKLYKITVMSGSILGYAIYSYFCASLILLIVMNHFLRSAFYVDVLILTMIYFLISKNRQSKDMKLDV